MLFARAVGLFGAQGVRTGGSVRKLEPMCRPAVFAAAVRRGQIGSSLRPTADRAEVIVHAVGDLPDGVDPKRVVAAQADLVARAQTLTLRELRREAPG